MSVVRIRHCLRHHAQNFTRGIQKQVMKHFSGNCFREQEGRAQNSKALCWKQRDGKFTARDVPHAVRQAPAMSLMSKNELKEKLRLDHFQLHIYTLALRELSQEEKPSVIKFQQHHSVLSSHHSLLQKLQQLAGQVLVIIQLTVLTITNDFIYHSPLLSLPAPKLHTISSSRAPNVQPPLAIRQPQLPSYSRASTYSHKHYIINSKHHHLTINPI
ncbi:hypothetical protein B0T20DRAFT_24303 [Sordaria brevicollis]|uniref:Uncharacterized protein n=1 Tax=Sordaria brevicollis TaxID=83679 RepID=A0AAE0UGJ8_SORBR|nr:hypothetical protein B0T20DRAFT_24303 [Sordaria brevicollis]